MREVIDLITELDRRIKALEQLEVFGDIIDIAERATPATPASGRFYVYAKTDGKLYYKNDAGTEAEVATV